MTKNRQQAFGNLDGKSQEGAEGGDNGAQNGAGGADGGSEGGKADEGKNGSQKGSDDAKKGKTYTDDDLDKIIKDRLARAKTEWEKQLEDEKNKLTEAQKLEKMNAQEKAEYTAKKLQAEIDQLKREKSFNEQMAVARKELSEKGINLSDALLKKLVSPDAETTKTTLDEFVPLWQKELNDAVQEALKRNPPKADRGQGQVKSDGAKAADKYNQRFQTGGN